MKVGDVVYVFDSNHRVYAKDGVRYTAPIYREHFQKRQIVGETSRSWIVTFEGGSPEDRVATKHAKKEIKNGLYTSEQVNESVYINDHAFKISEMVRRADYATLRKIAQLIGYVHIGG